MKPICSQIGSHHTDYVPIIAEAIRKVSPKAREMPILLNSLLLEELALDSLDLVAVILEVQDRFQVEIDPDEIPNLRCVDDLITSVTNQLEAAA
jgi:acyl carrier protein